MQSAIGISETSRPSVAAVSGIPPDGEATLSLPIGSLFRRRVTCAGDSVPQEVPRPPLLPVPLSPIGGVITYFLPHVKDFLSSVALSARSVRPLKLLRLGDAYAAIAPTLFSDPSHPSLFASPEQTTSARLVGRNDDVAAGDHTVARRTPSVGDPAPPERFWSQTVNAWPSDHELLEFWMVKTFSMPSQFG